MSCWITRGWDSQVSVWTKQMILVMENHTSVFTNVPMKGSRASKWLPTSWRFPPRVLSYAELQLTDTKPAHVPHPQPLLSHMRAQTHVDRRGRVSPVSKICVATATVTNQTRLFLIQAVKHEDVILKRQHFWQMTSTFLSHIKDLFFY